MCSSDNPEVPATLFKVPKTPTLFFLSGAKLEVLAVKLHNALTCQYKTFGLNKKMIK